MRSAITATMLLTWMLLAAVSSAAGACMGDKDLDGRVQVDEIITLVVCALDEGEGCPEVLVHNVVEAVYNAMYGCDAEPVRLSLIPCRQCDGCHEGFTPFLIGLAPLPRPEDFLPEDIDVLESMVVIPEAVCSACGCPDGPIYHVLVPASQASRLIELGWYLDR